VVLLRSVMPATSGSRGAHITSGRDIPAAAGGCCAQRREAMSSLPYVPAWVSRVGTVVASTRIGGGN
jgi:hypothetical protein